MSATGTRAITALRRAGIAHQLHPYASVELRGAGNAPSMADPGFGAGFGAGFGSGFEDRLGSASTEGARANLPTGSPRFARIEVRERGKRVVDLRIPISLGRFALGRVPGLSASHVADVEEAVASGDRGPILDIEDADGDGVRIVLE